MIRENDFSDFIIVAYNLKYIDGYYMYGFNYDYVDGGTGKNQKTLEMYADQVLREIASRKFESYLDMIEGSERYNPRAKGVNYKN
jgi:hypothetical protein